MSEGWILGHDTLRRGGDVALAREGAVKFDPERAGLRVLPADAAAHQLRLEGALDKAGRGVDGVDDGGGADLPCEM